MPQIHVLVVSLLVGLGSIIGLATAAHSAGIGQAKVDRASAAEIAAREQKIEAAHASLRKALNQNPPALPAAPTAATPPPARAVPVAVGRDDSDDDFDDDDGDDFESEDDDD